MSGQTLPPTADSSPLFLPQDSPPGLSARPSGWRVVQRSGLLGGALNRCVLSSNTPSLKGLRWLEEVPANGEGPLMGVRFLFEMVMVVEPYEYTKNV